MPVVKVRASKRLAQGDALVRKVTETTGDLLAHSDRVLVVYGKETASIYYEGEQTPSLPRAS
jgi:phenylpyruvate tautomerase PptA (4-oxalocrotonate tautomerase family)